MFLAQEPADVREKESAPGIVRIGVRVAKFVMDPVIPTPLVDVILLKNNQIKRERKMLTLKPWLSRVPLSLLLTWRAIVCATAIKIRNGRMALKER
jgi:hypothetical protein